MKPTYITTPQWDNALGYSRIACARIFRQGGSPRDAIRSFGLRKRAADETWNGAVERIAMALCAPAR
ncbi:MAG: hypothetical protein AAFQ42_08730 [Pseudomonadota bacterium]